MPFYKGWWAARCFSQDFLHVLSKEKDEPFDETIDEPFVLFGIEGCLRF